MLLKWRRGIYMKRLAYFKKKARLIPRAVDAYMHIGRTLERALRLEVHKPYESQSLDHRDEM